MIDRADRAGRFTDRVLIEEQSLVADSAGQVFYGPQAAQGNWMLVTEAWAHIEDTYGIEQKQSDKETNEEWVVVQIRYAPSLRDMIRPDLRIRHKVTDTCYDVRSVLVHADGQRKIIEMTCVLTR